MKQPYIIFAIFSFFFILLNNCVSDSNNNSIADQIRIDSLKKDSLRIIECDSLLELISENKTGFINLPDSLPTNIEECMVQLDTCTNDTIKDWIRCVTLEEYSCELHHSIGRYIRNKWGLWGESELSSFFHHNKINHPDDMSSIILGCFYQMVNTSQYNYREQIEEIIRNENEFLAEEKRMDSINSIKRADTKRFIDSLHWAINYDSILSSVDGLIYDSLNFFIKRKDNDTLIFWTGAGAGQTSRDFYKKYPKQRSFGKTVFYSHIDKEGDIWYKTITQHRFFKRNDTLYYEDKGGHFVNVLTPRMMKNSQFILQWEPVTECSFNKSIITRHWVLEGKNYYVFEMKGDCKTGLISRAYFVDENLNLIFDENLKKRLWKCQELIGEK